MNGFARSSMPMVVGTVSLAHFLSHVFLLAYPPLFPLLATEFNVSTAQLGLLVTAIYVPQLLLQLPFGEAVDRIGAKWILVTGLLITSLSIGASGFATSYWLLLGFAFVSGIGQSVFHPADYALLETVTGPDTEGIAFSAHTFGGFAGFAAAPLTIGTVGILIGWDVALIGAGLCGVLLTVGIALGMAPVHTRKLDRGFDPLSKADPEHAPPDDDRTDDDRIDDDRTDDDHTDAVITNNASTETTEAGSTNSTGTIRQFVHFIKQTDLLLVFLFYLVSMMALVGLQSFTTVLAVDGFGFTESSANTLLTIHLSATAIGVIAGGPLADRTSFRWVVVGLFSLAALGVAGLVLTVGSVGYLVAAVILGLVGLLIGLSLPSRDRFANSVVDPDAVGKSFGFFFTGLSLGAMISPALLGAIIDQWSATIAFVVVALFLAIAASIVVIAVRSAE